MPCDRHRCGSQVRFSGTIRGLHRAPPECGKRKPAGIGGWPRHCLRPHLQPQARWRGSHKSNIADLDVATRPAPASSHGHSALQWGGRPCRKLPDGVAQTRRRPVPVGSFGARPSPGSGTDPLLRILNAMGASGRRRIRCDSTNAQGTRRASSDLPSSRCLQRRCAMAVSAYMPALPGAYPMLPLRAEGHEQRPAGLCLPPSIFQYACTSKRIPWVPRRTHCARIAQDSGIAPFRPTWGVGQHPRAKPMDRGAQSGVAMTGQGTAHHVAVLRPQRMHPPPHLARFRDSLPKIGTIPWRISRESFLCFSE